MNFGSLGVKYVGELQDVHEKTTLEHMRLIIDEVFEIPQQEYVFKHVSGRVRFTHTYAHN
jgi:hypothetical protein